MACPIIRSISTSRNANGASIIGTVTFTSNCSNYFDKIQFLTTLNYSRPKDIYIAETSYDTWGGDKGTLPYPITPKGQKSYLKELICTVAATPDGHGKGIFYWAPEWIRDNL